MRLRLLVLMAVAACNDAPGDRGIVDTSDAVGDDAIGSTSRDGTPTGGGTMPTTGTPGGDTTLDPADEGPSPIVFDLGTIPDSPNPGFGGGIPETCVQALLSKSSVGCSFHANKMQNFYSNEATSLVVGNVSEVEPVSVQLYWAAPAGETAVGAAVVIDPLQTHVFVLDQPAQPGDVSVHRQGGTYRVESDRPVVAYQHSPINAQATNDSSLLIPDHALGQYYIVAAWNTSQPGHTSAFNVIALDDDTVVQWEPRNPTTAGNGVPAVNAFGQGTVTINRQDLLQVLAPVDSSGTVIEASKPVWAVGTVPCVNVPVNVTYCDHIEEQLIPLEYWGTEYVGAHAPTRGAEHYWWRIYSGADAVTITTNPPQPGTPITLDRGEFHEFSTTESFVLTSDGPCMPVQYLEGESGGAGTGDPASYQMVPVEQFLPIYVFVTGTGYTQNYVQIIRPIGSADVLVDDVVVGGYATIGAYEVADWPIGEGAHMARSDDPFGVQQVGYTGVTSYAYPGGLALFTINPNPAG